MCRDVRNTVATRRKAHAAGWRVAALLVALCLTLVCRPAYAADNETEMTGGFVPIELGPVEDGAEGSPQTDGAEPASSQTSVEPAPSQTSVEPEGLPLEDDSIVVTGVDGSGSGDDANDSDDTETSSDTAVAYGEIEMEQVAEAGQASVEDQPSDAKEDASIAAIVIAIVALAVVGIVLWRLGKRRQTDVVSSRPPAHFAS